jgi:ribonuclease Z
MELQFLGTGAGSPSKARNVTCTALKTGGKSNEVWLFDCGEATQHQILRTNIRPGKIRRIFITHLHGDHIFGLPGLLSSRSFLGGADEPLCLYGPAGIRRFVESALEVSQTQLSYPIYFHEFVSDGLILDDGEFTVSAFGLAHSLPSFAYRIEEKERAGGLQMDRLRELGIPSGPLLGRLKNGETVTLGDGRLIDGKEYLSPPRKGRIIAVFGDTKPCTSALAAAEGADVLVHEATFAAGDEAMAEKVFHSTVSDAANLAAEAGVKRLYLTHISARYADEGQRLMLERQAQNIFPASKVVGDFDVFDI